MSACCTQTEEDDEELQVEEEDQDLQLEFGPSSCALELRPLDRVLKFNDFNWIRDASDPCPFINDKSQVCNSNFGNTTISWNGSLAGFLACAAMAINELPLVAQAEATRPLRLGLMRSTFGSSELIYTIK